MVAATKREGKAVRWDLPLKSLVKRAIISHFILSSLILLEGSVGYPRENPAWQVERENILEAARKEGQVNVYVSFARDLVLDTFRKAYPDIKVGTVAGRAAQIAQRILAERRAGKYLADLVIAGGAQTHADWHAQKILDPIKPLLILPEVVDTSKWWQGRHRYIDPEGKYIFVFVGVPQSGSVYYNTNLVNPKEFTTLWDFVHPRWKGKIEVKDPRVPGSGGGAIRFFYHHPDLGPKFVRRLFAEMDITLIRDERQGTDWLAKGKFAICFFCGEVLMAKRQGLPVDSFGLMKEGAGLTSQGGTITLMSKAPHPNAAQVFINWLLSREGQIAWQKAVGKAEGSEPDSLRIDIPKDGVAREERRTEGVKYIDVDTPERRDMRPIFRVLEEALGEGRNR